MQPLDPRIPYILHDAFEMDERSRGDLIVNLCGLHLLKGGSKAMLMLVSDSGVPEDKITVLIGIEEYGTTLERLGNMVETSVSQSPTGESHSMRFE